MKKYFVFLAAAVAALLACGKTDPDPTPAPLPSSTIIYNLGASFAEDLATSAPTKGATGWVKSAWEDNDVIFVFSDKVAAPLYLKMTYSGGSWTCDEPNGSMGLQNGASGTFTAVYLPFGCNATISAGDEGAFVFSETYESLYWTATLAYTVTNNTVSGNFNMKVPDKYVQLWIEDSSASSSSASCKVGTDALRPIVVKGVDKNGNLTLQEKSVGANMPGYPHKGGYLFSGMMVSSYAYGQNYYFTKTKTANNTSTRADYFVSGKSLSSHMSITLPANNSSKWLPMGSDETVHLTKTINNEVKDYGYWYTCNLGETKPENMGTRKSFEDASTFLTAHKRFATKDELDGMTENLTWIPMSILRKAGIVAVSDTGFLFFPDIQSNPSNPSDTYFWGGRMDSTHGYTLEVNSTGTHTVSFQTTGYQNQVRFLYVP